MYYFFINFKIFPESIKKIKNDKNFYFLLIIFEREYIIKGIIKLF